MPSLNELKWEVQDKRKVARADMKWGDAVSGGNYRMRKGVRVGTDTLKLQGWSVRLPASLHG